jgi:hypothetical protein
VVLTDRKTIAKALAKHKGFFIYDLGQLHVDSSLKMPIFAA